VEASRLTKTRLQPVHHAIQNLNDPAGFRAFARIMNARSIPIPAQIDGQSAQREILA
jgi:hypothetical protein